MAQRGGAATKARNPEAQSEPHESSSLEGGRGGRQRVMGLEPTTFTLATCTPTEAKDRIHNGLDDSTGDARSAIAARSAENPDLRAVIDAWPDLPDAVRAGILAMVKASATRT